MSKIVESVSYYEIYFLFGVNSRIVLLYVGIQLPRVASRSRAEAYLTRFAGRKVPQKVDSGRGTVIFYAVDQEFHFVSTP